MRILVVDDEEGIRELLEEYLLEFGHEVTTASNGRKALELASQTKFDVALIDWLMPGISGKDVFSQLAQIQPDCARIVITGHADSINLTSAHHLIMALIRKPFSLKQVNEILEKLNSKK